MKIFLTGGTGFIGERILFALNGEVVILSRKKQRNYKTIVCDLQKEVIPDNALAGIDVVFHVAGFAHDLRDASDIEHLYRRVNIDATVKLAKMAIASGVKRFIFVSSVKAGGKSGSEIPENDMNHMHPKGTYGKTKREAEVKLLEIAKDSDMHVSIIRPSLVYGPDVKGNLKLMLSGIKNGWFPPLPETGNQRSMIHVDDLVRAIFLVAKDRRANGEIFIATDGVPRSTREIYNIMCDALGKSIPKWSIPISLFNLISLISPKIKYKVDKLFSDECYSSAKIEALGFRAKKSLKDMNDTDF